MCLRFVYPIRAASTRKTCLVTASEFYQPPLLQPLVDSYIIVISYIDLWGGQGHCHKASFFSATSLRVLLKVKMSSVVDFISITNSHSLGIQSYSQIMIAVLHPRKLTCPPTKKELYFNRKYI